MPREPRRDSQDGNAADMIHEYVEPFFHIGLLCRSVDHVAEQLAARFGMTFHDPQIFDLPHVDDGDERPVSVRACFSKVGPPHIELFEGDGKGIYQLTGEAALHHVGVWVPGCVSSLARAHDAGVRPSAVLSDAQGTPQYWFTDPADSFGIRFEMIDDGDRENLETFIRTGLYPGGPT
jgi:hypothetical protein